MAECMLQRPHSGSFSVRRSDYMSKQNKHIGIITLFVLPALLFYGTFNVVGIVRTFIYSFMDWKGISANRTFAGFGNYIELFGDSLFWNAMGNNVILVIVSVAIQLPGALLLALLINQELKGTRFFRTVFFLCRCCCPRLLPASCGFCFTIPILA